MAICDIANDETLSEKFYVVENSFMETEIYSVILASAIFLACIIITIIVHIV